MNRRFFLAAAAALVASTRIMGVEKKKSPAAESAPKFPALIDQKKCVHCGTCFAACPVKAISKETIKGVDMYTVDPKKCISCGTCIKGCPVTAIAWADGAGTTGAAKDSSAKKSSAPAAKKPSHSARTDSSTNKK